MWLCFSSSLGSLDYDRVEKSQGFGLGQHAIFGEELMTDTIQELKLKYRVQ